MDKNSDIQQKMKLDDVIDELWMLMKKTTKGRYNRKRRTTSKEVQLTEELSINKEHRKYYYKVQKPGRRKKKIKK